MPSGRQLGTRRGRHAIKHPPGWANKDVGGAFQIQNAKTHKCLTIAGGTSPQNNLEAVQFDYDSDVSRIWRLDQLAE
jgi:hypothetical protein